MSKIGDLFVRLTLKKDEFSKGIKEAGNEVSGEGGLLGKIKGLKVGAVAAWAAIAAGAVAMADKFAHTSQRFGDLWDQTMAGMKGAWNTFISAINSTDFSNLGKRLADSFREAKQLASMKDAEFEVMNSIELQKSAMKDELAILRVRMQNQKLSQKEREKAANEYLLKIKTIYDQEAEYRKKYSIQAQNTFFAGTGIRETKRNRETLQSFLTSVAPNQEAVKALDEYKKAGYRFQNEAQKQLLQGIAERTGGNLATLAKIADKYQSTNDEQAKALVNAIVAERAAAGAFNEETRRVQTLGQNAVTVGSGKAVENISEKLERSLIIATDRLEKGTERELEKLDDELSEIEPIKFEPVEVVPPDMDGLMEAFDRFKAYAIDWDQLSSDFRENVVSGFSAGIQELTDQLMGLEEVNAGKIVQALLTPLADMAQKEGELLMLQGAGILAAKKGLTSMRPEAMIAAGATLVAAAAAIKSGLAAIANAGSSNTSSYQGGAGAMGDQNIQTELTVTVKGELRGRDIVLAGQNTLNSWGR